MKIVYCIYSLLGSITCGFALVAKWNGRFLLMNVGLSHLPLECFNHPSTLPGRYLWSQCLIPLVKISGGLWWKIEHWGSLYHVLGDKQVSTNIKVLLRKKSLVPFGTSCKRPHHSSLFSNLFFFFFTLLIALFVAMLILKFSV